jgi:hypothetical protein
MMSADQIVGRLALLGYRPDGVIAAGLGDGRVVLCNVVDGVKTLPIDRVVLDRWGPWTAWTDTKPSTDLRRTVAQLVDAPSRVVRVVPPDRVGDPLRLDHHRDTSIGGPAPNRQQFSQMLNAANLDPDTELPTVLSFSEDSDFLAHCLSDIVPAIEKTGLSIDDKGMFCSLMHLQRTGLMPRHGGSPAPVVKASHTEADGEDAIAKQLADPLPTPPPSLPPVATSMVSAAPLPSMPISTPPTPPPTTTTMAAPGGVMPAAPPMLAAPSLNPLAAATVAQPPANYSVVDDTGVAVGHHDNFKKAIDHAQAHSAATDKPMHVRDNTTGQHAASLFPKPAPPQMATTPPGAPGMVTIPQQPANAAGVPGATGAWQAAPTVDTAPTHIVPPQPNDAGLPTGSPQLQPPTSAPQHGPTGGAVGVHADISAEPPVAAPIEVPAATIHAPDTAVAPKSPIGKKHDAKMQAAHAAISAKMVGGDPLVEPANDTDEGGVEAAPISAHPEPDGDEVPAPKKAIGKPNKKPKDMATAIGKRR